MEERRIDEQLEEQAVLQDTDETIAACTALLHAAESGCWRMISSSLADITDGATKALGLPGVIVLAAQASEWGIVKSTMASVPDNYAKDFCCLAAVLHSCQAEQWDVASHLADSVSKASVKSLCHAVAAPYLLAATREDHCIIRNLRQELIFTNSTDMDRCASVLVASQAAQWDNVRQFLQSVRTPVVRDVCCLITAFYAAKLEYWDVLDYFEQCIMAPEVKYLCCLAVIPFGASSSHWKVVTKLISNVKHDDIQNLCYSVIFSKAARAGLAKIVKSMLEALSPAAELSNAHVRTAFELNVESLRQVDLLSKSGTSGSAYSESVCSKVRLTESLSQELNSVVTFVNSLATRGNAASLTKILIKAKRSQWTEVNELLLSQKDTCVKDPICLAAVPHAAQSQQWHIVEKLVRTVQNPWMKSFCCLAAAPHAAKSQQWDFILRWAGLIKIKCVRDSFDLLRKRISDDRLCSELTEPQGDAILQSIWTGEGSLEGNLAFLSLDSPLKDAYILMAFPLALTARKWDSIQELIQNATADSFIKDYCCLLAIPHACSAEKWDLVKDLLAHSSAGDMRNLCCLAVTPFAVQRSKWNLLQLLLLQSISDVKVRYQCCRIIIDSSSASAQRTMTQDLSIRQCFDDVRALTATLSELRQCDFRLEPATLTRQLQRVSEQSVKNLVYSGIIKKNALVDLARTKELLSCVSNATMRNYCCLYVFLNGNYTSYDTPKWEILIELLETITDDGIKDFCLFTAAPRAILALQSGTFERLLSTIEDSAIQQLCLLVAVAPASQTAQWTVVRCIVDRVADKDAILRDRCCQVAMPYAARAAEWDLVSYMMRSVGSSEIKDMCCKSVISCAARDKHWDLVFKLIRSVSSTEARDFCCKAAAPYAVEWNQGQGLCESATNQFVKDLCVLTAAPQAAQAEDWTLLETLLPSVSDSRIKDLCHLNVVPSAAQSSKFELAGNLAQSASNATIKDMCCEAVIPLAMQADELDLAETLMNSISDALVMDRCCEVAAPQAAKAARWDFTRQICQAATTDKVKDLCILEAVSHAAQGNQWQLIDQLMRDVKDQQVKDLCYSRVVPCAASAAEWKLSERYFGAILSTSAKDKCCEATVPIAAAASRWNTAARLVQTVSDASSKDACCEAAVPFAADAAEWELVKDWVETVRDASTKNRCCEAAVPHAATAAQWDLARLLLESMTDMEAERRCCLEVIDRCVKSRQWTHVVSFLPVVPSIKARNSCCCRFVEAPFQSMDDASVGEALLTILKTVSDDTVRSRCATEAFVACVRYGRNDVVRSLLQSKIQPDMESTDSLQKFSGITTIALMEFGRIMVEKFPIKMQKVAQKCMQHSHVSVAYALLYDLTDIDWQDTYGTSHLMLAAENDLVDLVELLLKRKASLGLEDISHRTALARACEADSEGAVRALIGAGSMPQHEPQQLNCCCLRIAKMFDHPEILSGVEDDTGTATASITIPDETADRALSEELSGLLTRAGFTRERSEIQCKNADHLEGVARDLTQDERRMTGSFADGWVNNIACTDGRTASDSDIDWTVIINSEPNDNIHLEGNCLCQRSVAKLQVEDGHARTELPSGNKPAKRVESCGVRPAVDTCYAYKCCSSYREDRIRLLLPDANIDTTVHLVRATRPDHSKELRVSYSFQEKEIFRRLTTVQGQLYFLLKIAFKRLLPQEWGVEGLKTYHAKTLLFFMLYQRKSPEDWQPHQLVALFREATDLMLLELKESSNSPDVCMTHFFIPRAPLFLKNAGKRRNAKELLIQGLKRLIRDLTPLVELVKKQVRPLQSETFFFQPFALVPIVEPMSLVRNNDDARLYQLTQLCFTLLPDLQDSNKGEFFARIDDLRAIEKASSIATCLTAMAHIKLKEFIQAKLLLNFSWNVAESHRFCFPCSQQPDFSFLPQFTQSLVAARNLSKKKRILQVNFRCLLWSLQAEWAHVLSRQMRLRRWRKAAAEDPDVEELQTLAHYSIFPEVVRRHSGQMDALTEGREVDSVDTERMLDVHKRACLISAKCIFLLSAILCGFSVAFCLESETLHMEWRHNFALTVALLALLPIVMARELVLLIKFGWSCSDKLELHARVSVIVLVGALFAYVYSYCLISTLREDPCEYYVWDAASRHRMILATGSHHDVSVCPWDY